MLVEIGVAIGQELVFVFIPGFKALIGHVIGHKSSLFSGVSDELDRVASPNLIGRDDPAWRDHAVRGDYGSFFENCTLQND